MFSQQPRHTGFMKGPVLRGRLLTSPLNEVGQLSVSLDEHAGMQTPPKGNSRLQSKRCSTPVQGVKTQSPYQKDVLLLSLNPAGGSSGAITVLLDKPKRTVRENKSLMKWREFPVHRHRSYAVTPVSAAVSLAHAPEVLRRSRVRLGPDVWAAAMLDRSSHISVFTSDQTASFFGILIKMWQFPMFYVQCGQHVASNLCLCDCCITSLFSLIRLKKE